VRSRAFFVLLVGAAACAPSAPSAGPSPAAAPPVRALLSERDRLALSPEQVVALDSVSRALDVTERDVSRRLGIIKNGMMPRLSLGKPRGTSEVASNQSRAVRAVEQLLRPDQRQRLCQLARERHDKVALRDDKRALSGQRHTFAGAHHGAAQRTWPWCAEGSSHSAATAQSES
jgi:hypothetical protein